MSSLAIVASLIFWPVALWLTLRAVTLHFGGDE